MFKNRSTTFYIFIVIAFFVIFSGTTRLQSIIANPLSFIFLLLAILIALVLHEFAHALAADKLGDPNPRVAGRVSLNPTRHLDPLGTILIIVTGFGWGKPVGFDPYNLKDPVKDGALIAAAGPVSNLLLAFLLALLLRFIPFFGSNPLLFTFLFTLFNINLSLAIFNLVPLYPLDGHHILRAILPRSVLPGYDRFNRSFGILVAFLLILPIFTPIPPVNYLLTPALEFCYSLFLGV